MAHNDENLVLTCIQCRIGQKLSLEENFGDPNEKRDAFLGKHLIHGQLETHPEEHFRVNLLAQGFKFTDEADAQPRLRQIGERSGENKSLDGRKPPFGMPEKTEFTKFPMPSNERPDWDQYFLRIAEVVAERGTCSRLKVGAVLVKNNKIIATGYNGAPSGLPHCDHRQLPEVVGDEFAINDMVNGHCAVAEHAERNALLTCEVAKANSTMYLTCTPCVNCMRNMITAGVKRIVYQSAYRVDPGVFKMAEFGGIQLESKSAR